MVADLFNHILAYLIFASGIVMAYALIACIVDGFQQLKSIYSDKSESNKQKFVIGLCMVLLIFEVIKVWFTIARLLGY